MASKDREVAVAIEHALFFVGRVNWHLVGPAVSTQPCINNLAGPIHESGDYVPWRQFPVDVVDDLVVLHRMPNPERRHKLHGKPGGMKITTQSHGWASDDFFLHGGVRVGALGGREIGVGATPVVEAS